MNGGAAAGGQLIAGQDGAKHLTGRAHCNIAARKGTAGIDARQIGNIARRIGLEFAGRDVAEVGRVHTGEVAGCIGLEGVCAHDAVAGVVQCIELVGAGGGDVARGNGGVVILAIAHVQVAFKPQDTRREVFPRDAPGRAALFVVKAWVGSGVALADGSGGGARCRRGSTVVVGIDILAQVVIVAAVVGLALRLPLEPKHLPAGDSAWSK